MLPLCWLLVIRVKSPKSNRVVALSTIRRRRENPSERSGIGLILSGDCVHRKHSVTVRNKFTYVMTPCNRVSISKLEDLTCAWSSVFL